MPGTHEEETVSVQHSRGSGACGTGCRGTGHGPPSPDAVVPHVACVWGSAGEETEAQSRSHSSQAALP